MTTIPPRICSNPLVIPVAVLAACLLSGGAYAADFTWIGSGNWNTPENWSPAGFTSGNTPVFSGSAAGLTSNNDLIGAQIAGILFDADAASYTLTGNTGTLAGDILNNSGNLQTIDLGLVLNNNRTITTNGEGGDVIVNGVISQDAGNRSLTKAGEGTLTLTAANTYTGTTLHANGVLRLGFSATGAPVNNILSGSSALRFGASGVNPLTGHSVLDIVGKDGTANSQSFASFGMNSGAYGTLNAVAGSGGTLTVNLGIVSSGSNGGTVNIVAGSNTTIMGTTAPNASTGIYSTRYLWNGSDWTTGTESSPGVYTLAAYAGYVTNFTSGASSNVLLNGSASLPAGTTLVNTLKLETSGTGQSLAIGGGNTLQLASSGLLSVIDEDYSISGGTLRGSNNGTDLYIHHNGSGILTISSVINSSAANYLTKTGTGTLVLTGNNNYGNVNGGGTYVTGGILRVDSNARLGSATNAPTIFLNGGTLQAAATFALETSGNSRNIRLFAAGGGIDVMNAHTLTVSGTVSDGGDLTKTGSGTLVLTAANTYTGDTFVNAGTLLVGSTGSLNAESSVFVNNGGTLGGNGTINGSVTVRSGGLLAPGSSPGTLTVGSFSLESGGAIVFDLEGDASYDILAVSGDVTLAGNLSINPTYIPALSTSFTIIENNGSEFVSGTFAGLAEGATFMQGGQQFQITYLGGSGNDVVITAVPEPATAAILIVLGLGMMLWRIRRRAG